MRFEQPTNEEWRPAPGYEGKYEVSNLGRIRGVDRYVPNWPRGQRLIKGRIVGTNIAKGRNGYRRANLENKVELVHRLVALAFVPNPRDVDCVNHIDGNKLNNASSNLEWCTKAENLRHGFRNGLIPYKENGKGDDCGASKLREYQVRVIKSRLAKGESCRDIAKSYPVGESAIREIKFGRSWGHVQSNTSCDPVTISFKVSG